MRVIQIKDSYCTWSIATMTTLINDECERKYYTRKADAVLNRSYLSMYIEWWLHNIGYWVLRHYPKCAALTERCRHVDLEEWPMVKNNK